MRNVLLAALVLLAAASAGGSDALAQDAPSTPPDVLGDREFQRSNYPAAEAYYREALAAHPEDMRSLSRLALLLTWRGRYDESIDLYERGLKREPSSFDLKRGLATAYAWSDRYDQAIALYRRMLQERPGDEGLMYELAQAQAWSGDNAAAKGTLHEIVRKNPAHVKARRLLAQVHNWSGEHAAAERICRSLLAEDPDDVDALAVLGDALGGQGRNVEALAAYDKALSIDPKSRGALEGRARVLHSQGRTPEALDAVRQALELYPDARDARRLGRQIGGPLRPTLQLFANTTQDNDDNDLSTWGGAYTHHVGGRGYVGLTFTHAQTDATSGLLTPAARYDTVRVTGGWNASEHFSLYGEAGPERTELPVNTDPNTPLPVDSEGHVAGSLTFEVNGAGWFTLVGSVSEERLVGTTQAFMNDVGIQAATVTTIFRPHHSVRLRVTGQKARFTDDGAFDVDSDFLVVPDANQDNRRDLLLAGATWRLPLGRPSLSLRYDLRWMSYAHDLDQGYFDPSDYLSNTVGFDLSDKIGKHFYWGGGMDRGAQAIKRSGSGTAHNDVLNYRLLSGVNLSERASLEAYFAHSGLALQAASGFKSTEGGVRLVIRFGGSMGPAEPARHGPLDRSGTSD